MLPSTIAPTTKSSAERRLFTALSATDLPGGVCLHSLRLSRHEYKATGEIDFLIASPQGILVLEVKGGGVRRDDDGLWCFTDRYGQERRSSEGPFNQAESAMWSLRSLLSDALTEDELRAATFGFAVVLPDCDFDVRSVEWSPDIILDNARLMANRDLGGQLTAIQRYWRERRKGRPVPARLLDKVVGQLRPRFERVPNLRVTAREIDALTERLTDEQYGRLDIIEGSPRILCCGGAGTGKSFLALEVARRHADLGQSTLVTCASPTLLAFLRSRAGVSHVDFLPFAELERLPEEKKWEVVVLDEGQDVLDFAALEVLGGVVENGLEHGCWRIFLDPNTQAGLLGRFDPDTLPWLASLGAVRADLRRNCRNTTDIVVQTQLVTGADLGIPTAGSGPEVEYAWFETAEEETRALASHLRRLFDEGAEAGDVTILSPVERARSCVEDLPVGLRRSIRTLDADLAARWPVAFTTFSTVATFKGLENRFVCVVDVSQFGPDPADVSSLYVAMSRARAGLWLAVSRKVEDEFRRVSTANLTKVVKGGSEP